MPYVERRGTKWRVKWWAGEYLPNGNKKYESASGFADEEAARNHGLDREYEVRHGSHMSVESGPALMSDYCWRWLEAQDLRALSIKSYKTVINRHIIPYWGNRAVQDISSFEYAAWKKSLNERSTKGELSSTYARTILIVFGMIMDDAVEIYHLRKTSPVIRDRPHRGKYTKQPRRKKPTHNLGVVYALAKNAYTVWGYTGWVYIWTAVMQGMRPGEMYGHERSYAYPFWPASEPDPELREEYMERYATMPALRVQYQHQWINGAATLIEPKYESSRSLVMPPFLSEMHQRLLGSHALPWTYPSITGSPLLHCRFRRDYWYPIRDGAPARCARKDQLRAEIPPVNAMAGKRIYLLRHWLKEMLDEDGHPEIAVETRMGHEVAGVKGLYSNLTPRMEMDIAESLQLRWERLMGQEGTEWLPPFPASLPVDLSTAA